MLAPTVPILNIALRTVAVYFVVLLGMRLAGKREMGQLTVFDLVLLLLIANAVQNAMVGPDTSLIGGLLAAAVLLLSNAAVARLTARWPRLRRTLEGTPTVLVLHGELIATSMNREGLDLENLQAACRQHGVSDIRKVEMAVLETDGSISIIPTDEHTRHIRHTRHISRSN